VKNSVNFCSNNFDKEFVNKRNEVDEYKNTINIVTSQSTDKDKESVGNYKATIEEKDEIIQKLTNKIMTLETKIKSYEITHTETGKSVLNTSHLQSFKTNKKIKLNNSFLSTKSTSNLHFNKIQISSAKTNKNMLFNAEVSKNMNPLHEKPKNLNINIYSKQNSPKNVKYNEFLQSPLQKKTNFQLNQKEILHKKKRIQ